MMPTTRAKYVKKSVTIRMDQADWIMKTSLNLSRFLQRKLDEQMKSARFV